MKHRSTLWNRHNLQNPHAAADKARRVERTFAAIARRYDMVNSLLSLGLDSHWRRQAVIAAGDAARGQVLDICCGTGRLAREFARTKPTPRQILGCDFSLPMLRLAVRSEPRCRWIAADALRLPFADGSFDVVSVAFGIRNLPQTQTALHEIHRVLKADGRGVILEFALPQTQPMRYIYQLIFKYLVPTVGAMLSADRSGAYKYLSASVRSFESPLQLARRCRKVGFREVRLRRLLGPVVILTMLK